MCPKDCAYIVERLAIRFMALVADHSRQLTEHRAAFGARTEADAKIIAGLRSEIGAAQMAALERDSLMSERDGLLTQVQDMRVEIERMRIEAAKCKAERDDLYQREGIEQKRRMDVEDERDALRAEVADLRGIVDMVHASLGIKRGDHIGNAIAQLKAQTPKRSHPVAVGEYLRRTDIAPADMAPKVYRFKVAPVEPSRWGDTGPSPVQILQDMQDLPAIERARDPYLKIKADLVEWEPPKIKPRSKRGQRTRRWR